MSKPSKDLVIPIVLALAFLLALFATSVRKDYSVTLRVEPVSHKTTIICKFENGPNTTSCVETVGSLKDHREAVNKAIKECKDLGGEACWDD